MPMKAILSLLAGNVVVVMLAAASTVQAQDSASEKVRSVVYTASGGTSKGVVSSRRGQQRSQNAGHLRHRTRCVPRQGLRWRRVARNPCRRQHQLLSHKVHVNVRTKLQKGRASDLLVSVGLSDLNGLLYWWLR